MKRVYIAVFFFIHATVSFGGWLDIKEDYFTQDLGHHAQQFSPPQITHTYCLERLLSSTAASSSRRSIDDHLGVDNFDTPTQQDDDFVNEGSLKALTIAYQQIEKDIRRIQHPNLLSGNDLKSFQDVVADVLINAVRILAHHGSKLKFEYLKGTDLEYSQGWDRLASIIVYFYADASPEKCVSMFLNLLDSGIGRLLNPTNFEYAYEVKFVLLNNFDNRLQIGFNADDINSCHLDFVKSFGVGYLQSTVLNLVFTKFLYTADLLGYWLQVYAALAVHFRKITFTREECLKLHVADMYDLLSKNNSEFNWDVSCLPKRTDENDVDYARKLTKFLSLTFFFEDNDQWIHV